MKVHVKQGPWPRLAGDNPGQVLVRRIGAMFTSIVRTIEKKFDAMVCEACGFTDQDKE